MADEEDDAVEKESGGSKKKLIIIVIGALVLIASAVGGALMFMGSDEAEPEPEVEIVEEVVKGDPVYVDLKPAFTVNLDPDDAVGFLQISMQILTFDEDVAADIEKHKPLIRNNLMILFGMQKSVALRLPEGKTKLQSDVLGIVQSIINESGSGGEVDNVFFTTFVMQ